MNAAKLGPILLIALTTFAQGSGEATLAGFVTDTWCGRKGANAQHAEHARRSVASGVGQYAIYDEATKKLYILEPQATAAQYAGQRVKITGTLGATPLTRAGQSYAPDAVAALHRPRPFGRERRLRASQRPVRFRRNDQRQHAGRSEQRPYRRPLHRAQGAIARERPRPNHAHRWRPHDFLYRGGTEARQAPHHKEKSVTQIQLTLGAERRLI